MKECNSVWPLKSTITQWIDEQWSDVTKSVSRGNLRAFYIQVWILADFCFLFSQTSNKVSNLSSRRLMLLIYRRQRNQVSKNYLFFRLHEAREVVWLQCLYLASFIWTSSAVSPSLAPSLNKSIEPFWDTSTFSCHFITFPSQCWILYWANNVSV